MKALGGISSVFASVGKLDRSFLHVDKESLLQPRPAVAGTCESTGLLQGLEAPQATRPAKENIQLPAVYYRCTSGQCSTLSSTQGISCSPCSKTYRNAYIFNQPLTVRPEELESLKATIIEQLHPVEKATCSTGQGFVRENITYMVTDNLEVMPSTTIRSIRVLNLLRVASLTDMESTDIDLGITQVNVQLTSSIMIFAFQGFPNSPSLLQGRS